MNYLYLIHFESPIAHAQHYSGCTGDLFSRLWTHAKGYANAPKILQELRRLGNEFALARCWEFADYSGEQWLKLQKNGKAFCPLCHARPRNIRGLDDYPISLLHFPTTSYYLRGDSENADTDGTVRNEIPD